jgi:hypothetical protein
MTRLEKLELALKKGFTYNSENGIVTTPKGIEVKRKTVAGYIHLSIWHNKKRHSFLGHQFAWFFTYNQTVFCIDHIDKNKANNKISNLRSVTKSQNAMNTNNVKGYYYSKRNNKYIAYIMVNYKKKQLGSFDTETAARECYLKNKKVYHNLN